MAFKKATKEQAKLRMALIGPAGSGKTYSALNIGQYLGKKIAFIDTEHGSASKYADMFEFDVMEPESFSPKVYVNAIREAESLGYDVLIIDSLSHAWMGKDGALDLVDKVAKRSQSNNTFVAWREVTPMHNELVDTILASNMHIIATMRAKMDYVQEKDEKSGRIAIRKVGLAPIQREGLEFEFDVIGDLDVDNNLMIGKTRCPVLVGGIYNKPGKEVADILNGWLSSGEPATPKAQPAPTKPAMTPEEEAQHKTMVDACKKIAKDLKISDVVVIAEINKIQPGKKVNELTYPELNRLYEALESHSKKEQAA